MYNGLVSSTCVLTVYYNNYNNYNNYNIINYNRMVHKYVQV